METLHVIILTTLAINVIFNFISSITEKEDGYIYAFLG